MHPFPSRNERHYLRISGQRLSLSGPHHRVEVNNSHSHTDNNNSGSNDDGDGGDGGDSRGPNIRGDGDDDDDGGGDGDSSRIEPAAPDWTLARALHRPRVKALQHWGWDRAVPHKIEPAKYRLRWASWPARPEPSAKP